VAFTSLSFIAFIAVVALLSSALPRPGGRSAVLFGANLVFIGSYIDNVTQVAPLAAFLVICFLIVEGVRRSRSSPGLWVGMAVVIMTFIVLKKFSFLSESLLLPFPYLLVGLSYLLFRVVHLMIDAQQGELRQPVTPFHFFNYTCNFLSFTAGPIQRYQNYAKNKDLTLALDEDKVLRAFARVIKGFVKVAAVSAIFNYLFTHASGRLFDTVWAPPLLLFCAVYVATAVAYTVYLYANFAGYMDIVIGLGILMGQELPENFNQPFFARSFLEFWRRWHMTLSDWFKTYVFNPLLKALTRRFNSPASGPYLGVAAFFVTFLIMGVWHGTTSVFVVYGLLMGAGASINKLWQVMITNRLGKKRYKALAERPLVVYFSRGLTLAYFALALTCLWVDMLKLLWLTRQLGVFGIIGCYLGLAFVAGMAFALWDTLKSLVAGLNLGASLAASGMIGRNLTLAFQVLLIVTVSSFFHKAPEFVYRAF
jgi:alginate O-acetyltransferase complex protein AlgI